MTVDARGLSCPQPVLMVKNALAKENAADILVDNETAKENISRFAFNKGFNVEIEENDSQEYVVKVFK